MSDYMDGYLNGYGNGQGAPNAEAETAIRADQRAKCRAELRAKLAELCDTTPRHALWQELLDWARGPGAFGKKTKCNVGYSMVYADQKMVLVHRWLYQKAKGVTLDRTQELDHVVCSNRGCVNPGHLRVTDHASNAMRRLKSVNNTSGYKGVSWHKGVKKWTAQIRCSGKGRHIGYYADPISAARAYDREAIRLFGRENSILNFPGES